MRILFSWLKEFIEVSLPAEALAHRLTMAGVEVTGLTRLDHPAVESGLRSAVGKGGGSADWLLELEITPNRPDLLSHLGIAREVAAVLGRTFKFPRWLKRQQAPLAQPPGDFPISIEDPQGCRRYAGLLIDGVRVAPSPPWLVQRLSALSVRPVNNVVDATNLVLMELGQPLHAFDQDRLEGSALSVRRALEKETLVTIEGTTHSLNKDHLVIADRNRPVALAGIMGGRDTEIAPTTRRLLIESAWFEPTMIRRAVRTLKISSESSYRFERGIDPEMVPQAALRAGRLIVQLAGGKIQGGLIHVGEEAPPLRQITLKATRTQALLGARISVAQQRKYLELLGCSVRRTSRGLTATVPSYRLDLNLPEDLMEEVARLFGYDRCPETLPPVVRRSLGGPSIPPIDPNRVKEAKIRQLLISSGFQEIITYSLVGREDVRRSREKLSEDVLQLVNPLSLQNNVLRGNLLVGALKALGLNVNRKTSSGFLLFELGRIFRRDRDAQGADAPAQPRALGLLAAGTPWAHWLEPAPALGLFHLKGAIQSLDKELGIPLAETVETNHGLDYLLGSAVFYRLNSEPVGFAGLVHREVLTAYEIPLDMAVAYGELNLDKLFAHEPAPLKVKGLPKVPGVTRDLAMVVSEEVPYGVIRESILTSGGSLLQSADLFDLYRGPQISSGKKSLAFRLSFLSRDRTLTDEEIDAAVKGILDSLQRNFQAEARRS